MTQNHDKKDDLVRAGAMNNQLVFALAIGNPLPRLAQKTFKLLLQALLIQKTQPAMFEQAFRNIDDILSGDKHR